MLTPRLLSALGFLGMAGALSTDLYLPAFPSLRAELAVSVPVVQLTLTAFLVGSAFGQFFIGVVSDAFGRRRTLLVALAAFVVLSFSAAAAPSIEVLIGLRFAQGIFAAAGSSLARAIVGDLARGDRAARGMSILIAMMGLGPAVGSPLGALLSEWGGWRAALAGLGAIAVVMLAVAGLAVRESLPQELRHPALVGALARNVRTLLRDGPYVFFALSFAFSYGALMVYIGSSSFIVQGVFRADAVTYALTFSAGSVSYVLGALVNARIVRRAGVVRATVLGQGVATLAAVLLAVATLAGVMTIVVWVVLVCVFTAGVASSMSNASALTIGRAAGVVGAGSAVLGLLQFTCGALATVWGGLWGVGTALPTTLGMLVMIMAAVVCSALARALVRRA